MQCVSLLFSFLMCTDVLLPPQVSWTQALRTIVKNCYKQHGREDLLYAFEDQQITTTTATTQHHLTAAQSIAHLVPSQTVVQTINNPDGTVSLIQVRRLKGRPPTPTPSGFGRTDCISSHDGVDFLCRWAPGTRSPHWLMPQSSRV